MQKKTILRFGIIAILIAASLIFLSSSSRVHEEPTCCCKENMNNCPQKVNSPASGMIWETFSRQFISISPFAY